MPKSKPPRKKYNPGQTTAGPRPAINPIRHSEAVTPVKIFEQHEEDCECRRCRRMIAAEARRRDRRIHRAVAAWRREVGV